MLTKLKMERQKRSIKAKDLAKMAGVHYSYITLMEQGRVPSQKVKKNIANALGLPIREIWD